MHYANTGLHLFMSCMFLWKQNKKICNNWFHCYTSHWICIPWLGFDWSNTWQTEFYSLISFRFWLQCYSANRIWCPSLVFIAILPCRLNVIPSTHFWFQKPTKFCFLTYVWLSLVFYCNVSLQIECSFLNKVLILET